MDRQILSKIVEPLLRWFETNRRDLPWRRDREPYHVWLSEIMLQQTRVEAVRAYYLRFLDAAPDVFALAALPEDRLLKLWEGLGYYNRARNLQKCAKLLAARGGTFPKTKAELLRLPGIGDYTAGAIASICFDEPAAAVDGNVLRVSARLLDDDRPVDTPAYKKELDAALSAVYPAGRCGDFTQALMEMGATVCVPNGAPHCDACPLRDLCRARQNGTMLKLPVKLPKRSRRAEQRTVFLLRCGELIAVEKRPARGLLAGLWQLPNVERLLREREVGAWATAQDLGDAELRSARDGRHIFTHITWQMRCYTLSCTHAAPQFTWVTPEQLRGTVSLPTAFRQFLDLDDL
ncbi:MAG: A/G-specific adenine glycosylase [Oscillospiraceae bacterium]|nr:A/G-specific adenine glycosylase [Oscillospiraceae bacterium]